MGTKAGKLVVEEIHPDDLDYDNMAAPPPFAQESATDWTPYLFDSWYTEALDEHLVAPPLLRVQLTPAEIKALQSSEASHEALSSLIERLQTAFSSEGQQVFVRTSMCSTKIGTTIRPCLSGAQCVKAIRDSQRCLDGLSAPMEHSVWLFPWSTSCDIYREFRVFVRKGKVLCLCPYYCCMGLEWLDAAVAGLVGKKILSFWEQKIKPQTSLQDLVFDVLVTGQQQCQLIEFNPLFTSGGLLFSWVEDADLLSGKCTQPVLRFVRNVS